MSKVNFWSGLFLGGLGCLLAGAEGARAQEQSADAGGLGTMYRSPAVQLAQADTGTKSDTPAAPANWSDTLKFSGHLEVGFTANADDPKNQINFGSLFTDKSNRPLLNQLLLTAERPLDPKAEGYDFGFKLQGMYGSDARYTHFLNEFDRAIRDKNQFDIVEANLVAHLPLLTDGGIDLKLGQYSTPIGFEVIDAAANTFYSHSYIFNFGIPLKHTGGYLTAHASDTLDVILGGDTGVNTSLGKGDNNGAPAFLGGVGLNNLLDGKLTILALTHIGPENPTGTPGVNVNSALRYLNDIVLTYKHSDELTFVTELNYIRDDGVNAAGGGAAQYVTYQISDALSASARAEYWRDDNGFFVSAAPGTYDFVNVEKGLPARVVSGGKTSYGALTLGLTIKPPVPGMFEGSMIRPEIRYDRALNDTKPFGDSKSSDQFTAAVDFILAF
jgi:hypothetical protein